MDMVIIITSLAVLRHHKKDKHHACIEMFQNVDWNFIQEGHFNQCNPVLRFLPEDYGFCLLKWMAALALQEQSGPMCRCSSSIVKPDCSSRVVQLCREAYLSASIASNHHHHPHLRAAHHTGALSITSGSVLNQQPLGKSLWPRYQHQCRLRIEII